MLSKLPLGVLLLIWATVSADELRLNGIFGDHMVLQREKAVAIWGWANPNEVVTVEFNGQKKKTEASADGKWMVKLDSMKANAEPQKLIVNGSSPNSNPANPRECVLEDILIGEVWLGSGQSNMSWTVSNSANPDEEKAAANYPLIREFGEKSQARDQPKTDCKGKWTICSPATVGGYSASLYYMARELHRELKVPVGIIQSSVGGTPIENWIDTKTQLAVPELKETIDAKIKSWGQFDEVKAKAKYEKEFADWKAQNDADIAAWNAVNEKAKLEGKPLTKKPEPKTKAPADPIAKRKNNGGPGELFNGKIAGLIPMTVRGVIWYQGEANSYSVERGKMYQTQMETLVTDWRKYWGEELPFCWVQLPNYADGQEWPTLRESQLKCLRLPNTGMVIAIDIGEKNNIHPKNKQEIGRRFSLWALSKVYGQKSEYSGPLPASREIKGANIVVSFTHADGLKAKTGLEIQGFEIASGKIKKKTIDANNKEVETAEYNYVPAKAVVRDGKVVVSADTIQKPIAVRYAWANFPICNLVNQANLPASPFRFEDK